MINIVKIDLLEIDGFKNHPFSVKNDSSLNELLESIKTNGLLNPIIVRKKKDGRYEIISGHRRKYVYELLEKNEIECNVVDVSDDEATIQMVDSNIFREKILPSEKAYAYKMKMDAIKHQGKSFSPKGTKVYSTDSIDDTKTQIYRFIRLTYLIPELMSLVDNTVLYDKRTYLTMGIKPAVELSYLSKEEQKLVYETIKYNDATPSWIVNSLLDKLNVNRFILHRS